MRPVLAFSTNAFTRFGLVEALGAIGSAGYGAVEILADAPHADPPGLTAERIGEIATAVREAGLLVSNVNCNCSFSFWRDAPGEPYFEPSLISPDPGHRAVRAERIGRAMELAAALPGVVSEHPPVSITSGRCLGYVSPEVAGGVLREQLVPLLEKAEGHDVNVGIECEPGLYVEYAAELAGLIDALGHPRLGANLDTGHSHVLGESMAEALGRLRGRVWNLHVEDLPGRKHWHMIPGRGTFPWGELMTAVRETGCGAPMTVELYTHTADPVSAARESLEFLSRLVSG